MKKAEVLKFYKKKLDEGYVTQSSIIEKLFNDEEEISQWLVDIFYFKLEYKEFQLPPMGREMVKMYEKLFRQEFENTKKE